MSDKTSKTTGAPKRQQADSGVDAHPRSGFASMIAMAESDGDPGGAVERLRITCAVSANSRLS